MKRIIRIKKNSYIYVIAIKHKDGQYSYYTGHRFDYGKKLVWGNFKFSLKFRNRERIFKLKKNLLKLDVDFSFNRKNVVVLRICETHLGYIKELK
jgi:hypothetical protein